MNTDFSLSDNVPNRRLPIYLLLDASHAMAGAPIQAINQGINLLYNELMNDPSAIEVVWVSVITFGHQAQMVTPLTELTQFVPPQLNAGGWTPLGAGLKLLNDSLERDVIPNQPGRKGDYKAIIFIMIASTPTDKWEYEAHRLKQQYQGKVASVVVLGCGGGVNVRLMKQVSETVLLMDNVTPEIISQYFKWVSQSAPTAGMSAQVTGETKTNWPPPPKAIQVALY